ncbi:dethiobiotin synthase [Spirosoma radiotolerans]|uniref:ATP-dependent dethiobiotin synthetase BioD n=1 Tax=Spirosoma radiotolerans TaxID=1379870 RepID=A0A0E3ZYZ7_9BACT|nr:dethiobiotin synthase [Spirosoma radiotolerans]AKD57980.1 ATP-dependent dethiobiotin synthetase BioD [Spirosoma radiotolerans]
MTKQTLIVAGIGTEIGKTIASAVLVEALQADYWKPIQSGGLDDSDTDTVRRLISNPTTYFHSEAYRLTQPLSPHAAAEIDGVTIELEKLTVPETQNALVIELAGGLMVPLNNHDLSIDLVQKLGLPVVLVSRNYLGSINHTLLSVDACRGRNIPLLGILFNGPTVPASETFILNYTGLPCLGRIGQEAHITKETIQKYARLIRDSFEEDPSKV